MNLADILGYNTSEIIDKVTAKLNVWLTIAIENLPNLFLAILVLILTVFIGKFFRNISDKYIQKLGTSPTISRFLSQLLFISILVLGIMLSLSIMDLSKTVSSILAGLGIMGLALGFAFQDTAANFMSGVYITFRQPYKLTDIIKTYDGHEGSVVDIDLRVTKILTFDGQVVHVPNRYLFQENFINYSETGVRRIQIECGISYGEDLEHVEEVAMKAMRSLKSQNPDKEPSIFWMGFGDSSINFILNVWATYQEGQKDFIPVRNEAIKALKKAFDSEGITIPFPIRTLDFGIKGGRSLNKEINTLDITSANN